MISCENGEKLVKIARSAVKHYLTDSTIIDPEGIAQVSHKVGAFVTLNSLDRDNKEHLMGCIGYPLPEKRLYKSVIEASIAAATQDPRLPRVTLHQRANIIFEISVLTPLEEIIAESTADYEKNIKIGRDGLILQSPYGAGLLLPQVPVEMNWSVNDYLSNLCRKAGAPSSTWLISRWKLFRFEAFVFKELTPDGKVIRVTLESKDSL